MSAGRLSKKRAASPASNGKTASKASASGLLIGEPDDSFEREADRMADELMAGASVLPVWSLSGMGIGTPLQRKCACGGSGECDECKDKETLRRKSAGTNRVNEAPPIVDDVLRSPGSPLDPATRDFFESRFGHSFSRVRIHTGGLAAESARAVDALAYTVGEHVVFGAGAYAPESARGRGLLAHELAHAVQQGQTRPVPAPHSIQRATAGWSKSAKGSLNAKKDLEGNIWRIPIENLKEGNQQNASGSSESAVGRAIVLLHKNFDVKKSANVLLFFHGHNEGYRMGAFGNRDKDVYQMEAQVDVPGKEQLIGILPQGTQDSGFGEVPPGTTPTVCNKIPLKKAFNSDAYITEILNNLASLNSWTANPTVGNVIVSGHSGGGEEINQGLLGGGAGSSLPRKLGALKEVALFDAINGPCEFVGLMDWLQKTLQTELADLKGKSSEADQRTYLKSSMRFRSYFERSKPIGNFYSRWNIGPLPTSPASWKPLLTGREPLQLFLSHWFQTNATGLPPAVASAWTQNYAVVDMGTVAHDNDKVNVMTGPTPAGSTPVTESINVLPKREPGAGGSTTPEAPELVQDALRSSSRALGDQEKRWARSHFGHDFGHVRVHTNGKAAESARAVKSLAYTVGRHIVFDPTRYDIDTLGGRRLLGHELTHVLQQGSVDTLPGNPAQLRMGCPEDPLEREADRMAEEPGAVSAASPGTKPLLQRAPAEGQLAKAVCETTAKPPKEEVGECNYARPENCATYESWIETFARLKTFSARATPSPGTPGPTTPNTFTVLGGGAATRFADKPDEKDMAKDTSGAPFPTTGLKLGETFIDHPTDAWVKGCLPDNLRATAYQLPADCADIAIILRHVWLSAHHRTQTLQVGRESWVIGDEKGGPGRTRALKAIVDIGSQTVTSLVAPYSDAQGNPLLTFAELAPLLHPGDILVWEHRENGLDKGRTGGHTLTITAIKRDAGGKIQSMSFLQGNEPIFGSDCAPGAPDPTGACAASDDKAKIIQKLKLKDTPSIREQLGSAPGRRIETASTDGPAANGITLTNPDLELPVAKKGTPAKRVWGWGDKTILVAAGPPKAATRPATATPAKGALPETHLTDWIKSFAAAASDPDWQAAWEAMLLEARSFIEGGRDILRDEASQTGDAAGKKFWTLSKQPKGTLGDETHFLRLRTARKMIQLTANSRKPAGKDPKSKQNVITSKLHQTLNWIDDAFNLAARGVSDITFGPAGKSVVKVLMTGFDPFEPSGSLAAPAKGTWNPSGAAILALDNTDVAAKSSKGAAGTAKVQGVILPVSYEEFRAGGQGLVESIVTSKAADIDAAITVSMDSNLTAAQPVRLERYVVGTHDVPQTNQQGQQTGRKLEPVPAAGSANAGDEIIESNAPLGQIAADTEKKSKDADKSILKPEIGEKITFRFASDAAAKTAASKLGGTRAGRDVVISDEKVIHQIIGSMVRQPNGIDIGFKAAGGSFTATVVEGPGGNFLSNEVSYRMLRLLKQKSLPQDPLSFHVHTQGVDPIPQDKGKPAALKAARGFMSRLVETLKRIVAATAKVILDRRASKKP